MSFRADESTVEAIEWLLENTDGSDRSEVIRRAILDEARQLQNDRIRAQAEAIAADEDDRAEMRAVRADLDAIRAW
ncbi:ribbon-helix-helix protein, CopG family [Sciscionella sediminilitoris]|uniref:ribbon-helix-helix protein, CopG family n=1 Tax=Sciscionella sediminilitoris TaxID=1445613 RepID=UPI0006894B31|nr:ribbon-helix-helix protein, CopG family [Sciscionella sp. SE31]